LKVFKFAIKSAVRTQSSQTNFPENGPITDITKMAEFFIYLDDLVELKIHIVE